MVRWVRCVAALGLCACTTARSAAEPLPHNRGEANSNDVSTAFFVPGERIVYEISWFDTLVGRLEQTASQPSVVDGQRAIEFRSVGRSDGAVAVVRDMSGSGTTVISLETGLPMYVAGMTFDDVYSGDALDDGLRPRPHQRWAAEIEGGQVAHDTHSLIAQLRGWRAVDGEGTHRYMKINNKVLRADALARRQETLTTRHGRRSALRIDGVITRRDSTLARDTSDAPYPFVVWVSSDEDRVPIRYHIESRYGSAVKVELVYYERPGESARTPRSIDPVP